MRLCVVAGSFHPEVGGPSIYLHRLIPALVARGHHVTVITHTDSNRSGLDSTFSYPVYRVSRRWPVLLRILLFTWRVLRLARTVDLLFVSDYGMPAALANVILRKPMVLKNVGDFAWEFSTRHGLVSSDLSIDEFQLLHHDWRVRLLQRLIIWYVRAANVVLVPSRYVRTLVTGWGVPPDCIRVIYNALDERQFASVPDRVTARREVGLPASEPVLLTVARLVPWKGIGTIVRVLPRVQRIFPDAHLLIVGDGPERTNLEALASPSSDSVDFLGFQSQQHVHRLMCAADVFVLFSTYEGFPHTLLEAMACRLPVIASAVGGTLEAVIDGRTGVLVPSADEEQLVAAICRVLKEPEFGSSLAERAHEKLERFSWERMVADTEAVLLEVVS